MHYQGIPLPVQNEIRVTSLSLLYSPPGKLAWSGNAGS